GHAPLTEHSDAGTLQGAGILLTSLTRHNGGSNVQESQPFYRKNRRAATTWSDSPGRAGSGAAAGSADAIWRTVDASTWYDFISSTLDVRALASFSASSDGGVLHTFVQHGRRRDDHWARNADHAERCWRLWTDEIRRYGTICTPGDQIR